MNTKKSIKSVIIAHLDGELPADELKKLSDWVSGSRENARYYAEIKDMWEATVSNASQIAETEKEWQRFTQKIDSNWKKSLSVNRFRLKPYLRYAALLTLGLFIGGGVIYYSSSRLNPVFCTAIAPMGSVSKVILSDSTTIFLNAGSQIRYSVDPSAANREVFLDGEAWFKVTHNRKKPFVVHTHYYNVNVLGTEFNVKSYADDNMTTTTLEKGMIMITSGRDYRMDRNIVLNPGEQLVYDKNRKDLQIREVKTDIYTSWKDNKLQFVKMSLKELIVLLERKYGVVIEVDDPVILDYHYTGTIKNETILEILDMIEHTMPIHYEIEGQLVKIYKGERKEV